VVPLILPLGKAYGIDPIHLGIIFLANMELGYLTPSVGLNLFISSYTFNETLGRLYRFALPFILLIILNVILITYMPWITSILIPT
jgi:TRAP-type C4-dicarboxylate transport system permease large subunit